MKALVKGMQANIPLAISAMAYGGVFGVLSANHGVSWAEMLAMDLLLFAGSAQLVMIEMWSSPIPVFAIGLAVLIINIRYLLIGASLRRFSTADHFGRKCCACIWWRMKTGR
jgi:predicted branched-subunit amino acid permease